MISIQSEEYSSAFSFQWRFAGHKFNIYVPDIVFISLSI